ncbi:MAG TPA: DNA methyltransferase [Methanocella sp.]|jgi:DNA modification methylase
MEDADRQKSRTFNGLSAKEWASMSRNVWDDVSSPRQKKHIDHGATFPEKLAARLIRLYSRPGDLVLDPFLGTGTTLEACLATGRNGIGIELNGEFCLAARHTIKHGSAGPAIEVINDDCRNLARHVEAGSVQLMITSPPYADFIRKSVEDRSKIHKRSRIAIENNSRVKQYSNDPRDFGNLTYDLFLLEMKSLIKALYVATKPGGYNVWVVKDYRDTKKGVPYIAFHSDLARLGEECGFRFHDLIVWDQNDQRSLILLGYPSVFYTNQNCSFLVVFRKPQGTQGTQRTPCSPNKR